MGLDVYLYHYDNYELSKNIVERYEKECEKNWSIIEDYETSTEEEKESVRLKNKKIAKELGITFGEYGAEHFPGEEAIKFPSIKNPDHLFKIGYFRSSYNEGGIERKIENFLGKGFLYYVFEPDDNYEFSPDWGRCLERIERIIKEFNNKVETVGFFGISCEDINPFVDFAEYSEINSIKAMEIFLKAKQDREEGSFSNYSNKMGLFIFGEEPLKVRGAIRGITYGNRPCIYLIYEEDVNWYKEAMEIVKETILYVLSKKDPNNYYLHWSC